MSLLAFPLFGATAGLLIAIYSLFSYKLPLIFLFICDITFSFFAFSLFAVPLFSFCGGVFSLYQPIFFLLGFALLIYIKKVIEKALTKTRK